jgi:AsmA protein
VTAATGLKRLGIPVAAIVLACFAALAAVSFFMPFDTVRDAAKAEIRNVTGLDVVLKGDVDVSLFPTGSITFANVTLGEDSNPVLVADHRDIRHRSDQAADQGQL